MNSLTVDTDPTPDLITADSELDRASPRRPRRGLVAAVVVVSLAAGFGAWAATGNQSDEVVSVEPSIRSTVTVERRDITSSTALDATLTYADPATMTATRSGTVTWLPDVGTTIDFGQVLVEIDGIPVILLPGDLPSYRTLSDSVDDGDDVQVLEQALTDLGFAVDVDMTIDREFTAVTAQVVELFREASGLSEVDSGDDELALGDVRFASQATRVAGQQVAVGDTVQTGTAILSVTAPERLVALALDAADQSVIVLGDAIEVELPNGDVVGGTATQVSTVARAVTATGQNDETTYVIDVEITLASGGEGFDEAPVDVLVTDQIATGVLTVPVEAVLALGEGGYAIEIVEGAGTRLVAVQLGSFDEGVVEIEGEGITEGLEVVSA